MTDAVEGQQRAPLLSLRGINKSFGAVQVLRSVDLDVRAGEVRVFARPGGERAAALSR